jgi:hypothetical protein
MNAGEGPATILAGPSSSKEVGMIVFIIATLMAFGGYAVTIPLLIHDEWVQWRARRKQQTTSFFGKDNFQTEVKKWDFMATT